MVLAWPAAHVGAGFGDDLQRSLRTDGIDLAQVGAASEPMQRAPDIECGSMLGESRAPCSRQ